MNFPRFWIKGEAATGGRTFESWGWSDASAEEAKRRGEESARRAAERFVATGRTEHRRYYLDRPFREEVLETIGDKEGSPSAVITRNSYGCNVLNAAGLMFVDVDLEAENDDVSERGGWLSPWFGRGRSTAPPKNVEIIIARAREWAERHAGWGWRVYRTKAGLRFAATHQLFEPQAVEVNALFDVLTADPLYRKLCQNQRCFRARLTPKPWRCGMSGLTVPWPWNDARAEKRFAAWEKKYLKASADFATCTLVTTLGDPQLHPEVEPIIRLHDDRTRVNSGLPLA